MGNTWKAVTSSVGNAVAIMDRKWDAFKARFAHMRCRVKSGVREFYDKSANKWKRMTPKMEEFVDVTKANLREGAVWTFDASTNAWRAVVEAVGDAGEFLDARWDAFKARMKNVRCRVRDG